MRLAFIRGFTFTEMQATCVTCGRKRLIRDAVVTGLCGWWSLAGIVFTPILLAQNIAELKSLTTDRPAERRALAVLRMLEGARRSTAPAADPRTSRLLAAAAIAIVLAFIGLLVFAFGFYTPD